MMRKRRFALTENMGVVINADFFRRNTDIAILDLSYGYISQLPNEVLLLEDLEYLSIANTSISSLQLELGGLRYLENIVVDNSALIRNPNYSFVDFTKKNSLLKLFQEAMKPRIHLPPFSFKSFENKVPSFTVFSWNILADHAVNQSFFPLCQPKYLQSKYREDMIISKTLQLKPDIICFQEFELRLCEGKDSMFIDKFVNDGYKWNFAPKARISERKDELKGSVPGQVTLFSTKKFDLIDSCVVEIRNSEFIQDKTKIIDFCDDTVLFTLLRSNKDDINLLIINVHMFYRDETVRFAFASAILQEAEKFVAGKVDKYETVVMGDFNDTINSKSVSPFLQSKTLRSVYDEHKYNVITCQNVFFEPSRIDHILVSNGLHSSALLNGISINEIKEDCPFIPSESQPSDHHPVGAALYI